MVQIRRFHAAGMSDKDAARAGLEEVGLACFLTAITTSIGFWSLSLAQHEIVREFGWSCVLGVVLTVLAILTVLHEQPRHPYDVAATLKVRKKHESIKLNYGSLYDVVDALERDGFIEVVETVRDGRRPERTIYGITEAGLREMTDWLAELVATPQQEFTQFEAALSLLPALPPDDAADLLEQRMLALEVELARSRSERRVFQEELGLPRLFGLESEYGAAVLQAELAFVRDLLAELRKGTLDGIELWESWYAPGATYGELPAPDDA